MDVLGVILALVGLLSLFALLSSQRSVVSGGWVTVLYRLAGWGAFVLPLGLLVLGLWLVLRNVDRLPVLSAERLVGIVLLFLTSSTWAHFLAGGGWTLVESNRGGGYIGALFEYICVSTVGKAGTVVILVAGLLISLLFLLDLSVPDLINKFREWVQNFRKGLQRPTQAVQPMLPNLGNQPAASAEPTALPQRGFRPLAPRSSLTQSPPASSSTPVAANAPAQSASEAQSGLASNETTLAPESSLPVPQPAWRLPDIDGILDPGQVAAPQADHDQERAHIIESTLASFGVPVHVVEISRGPVVTQFGVEPDFIETREGRTRVRVAKIVALADDLALALAAPRIRIQAPVPGRNYVGIEVPNTEISRVKLREVIESEAFLKLRPGLRFGLGKDVAGRAVAADLSSMPHLLIAGTTGSGKSVCVNAILCSLLLHNTPQDLRLVLVDPKRVELTGYNGIPHLMGPVVVDPEKVVGALQWMLREMDSRYRKFSEASVRNIQDYNKRFPEQRLPFIVAVVDELADLMLQAPDETERTITRLAQLARATGIHLILATQRPSVNVVTGLIKANFPARIAFMVAQQIDSRVILDQPGAEQLLGRGDMLFQSPDSSAPQRLQGAHVSDLETQRLVGFWRGAATELAGQPAPTSSQAVDALPRGVPLMQTPLWDDKELGAPEGDPVLNDAIELVRREGRASITMLQRRMRIGYTRAARLIDTMEDKGIVGPPEGTTQVREVLDYGSTAPPKED